MIHTTNDVIYSGLFSSPFLPHYCCSDINGGQVDDEDFEPDTPYWAGDFHVQRLWFKTHSGSLLFALLFILDPRVLF
jgi:hypothetical protein